MKIGILSDTHDCIDLTRKAIKKIEEFGCKALIHCGDFCAPFMIKEFSNFSGNVHCCFGNTDDKFLSTKLALENNINLCGNEGEIEIDNKKIAFVHFPKLAKGLASTKKYDAVFYGHTHTSNKEKINSTWLVNPGEIIGLKQKPSFAVYDTKTNSVEIIEL
jgi:hypothetical protein